MPFVPDTFSGAIFSRLVLWRRYFQFSLSGLLAIVAIACVFISAFSSKLRNKLRERHAIESIERLGGFIAYDWHISNLRATTSDEECGPPGPRWLRATFGDDIFAHVALAQCKPDEPATDADIAFLDSLPELIDLRLENARLSSNGFERFAKLPLRRLALRRVSAATENCWRSIKHLATLRELYILSCNCSDADLPYLAGLAQLEELSVVNTNVTPNGIARLRAALPRCKIYYQNAPNTCGIPITKAE